MNSCLFLGDSITDSHRLWLPEYNGLGDGYVSILGRELNRNSRRVSVINKGIDGFTVPALLSLLDRSPICSNPDIISLLIGINDVGIVKNTGVTFQQMNFAATYQRLLLTLKERCSHLLCFGPFLFPHPQEYLLWIPEVRKAESIMAETAASLGIPFYPLHDYLNRLVPESRLSEITLDGFHLTSWGHDRLAEYMLPYFEAALSL